MEVRTVGVLADPDSGDQRSGDRRVPLTPDGARRLAQNGLAVMTEAGCGQGAWYPDEAYLDAGAQPKHREEVIGQAQVLLTVNRPPRADLDRLQAGQVLIGLLGPQNEPETLDRLAARGVTVISMERLPRTLSRAQSLDVLTSQAGVAGYKAALVAADTFGRYFPLMITAAGTSRPARVLVLGAGVAGLAAMGTARRLGAVVTGYDVRPETKEEVESMGARFLEMTAVVSGTGAGGYARALTPEEQRAQQEELESHLGSFDVVITTAAVPGGRPPRLLSKQAVDRMAPGSVVVDMAAGPLGGNVEGSVEDESTVTASGVTLVGAGNLAARLPTAASDTFSQNMVAVLGLLVHDGELTIDPDDPVLAAIVVPAREEDAGERVTPV